MMWLPHVTGYWVLRYVPLVLVVTESEGGGLFPALQLVATALKPKINSIMFIN